MFAKAVSKCFTMVFATSVCSFGIFLGALVTVFLKLLWRYFLCRSTWNPPNRYFVRLACPATKIEKVKIYLLLNTVCTHTHTPIT